VVGIISLQCAQQQLELFPPPYITVHPQQPPFFSLWSSLSNLVMPFEPCPFEPGAPPYDDISLLYLRISRTMS
jgi:hypothetical protein